MISKRMEGKEKLSRFHTVICETSCFCKERPNGSDFVEKFFLTKWMEKWNITILDEGNLVSSGVYFYTLEVNGKEIDTRKMIMLK